MKIELPPRGECEGEKPHRKITLTLFAPSPSVNSWTYAHWGKYYKAKKQWLTRIGLAIDSNMFNLVGAEIHVERYAKRLIDQDNAVAGLKPIIDSLVRLGLLADDSAEYLRKAPTVEQIKVSKNTIERTVINISERKV